MKKLFSILAFSLAVLTVATLPKFSEAQSTTPRFGITKNNDATGRVLNFAYVSVTDAAGADSVVSRANAWETIYRVTLTDSLTFKAPVVTNCKAGDNIVIVASAASGTPKLKFSGTNWVTAGTATLSTGLRAVIRLVFDGAKWVEASRVVQ